VSVQRVRAVLDPLSVRKLPGAGAQDRREGRAAGIPAGGTAQHSGCGVVAAVQGATRLGCPSAPRASMSARCSRAWRRNVAPRTPCDRHRRVRSRWPAGAPWTSRHACAPRLMAGCVGVNRRRRFHHLHAPAHRQRHPPARGGRWPACRPNCCALARGQPGCETSPPGVVLRATRHPNWSYLKRRARKGHASTPRWTGRAPLGGPGAAAGQYVGSSDRSLTFFGLNRSRSRPIRATLPERAAADPGTPAGGINETAAASSG
jgi:hypothetical protein